MGLKEGKLAVVVISGSGDENETEICISSIQKAWQTDSGPFMELELIQLKADESQGKGLVKNAGLQAARQSEAEWVLILSATASLNGEAFKALSGELEKADGLWGLIATSNRENDQFNVRMPQILSLDHVKELLLFPPQLTLETPGFLKVASGCEVGYNPDLTGQTLEMDFALRFWSRFRGKKLPVPLAASLPPQEPDDTSDMEACLKLILAARQEIGLNREEPGLIQVMNEKVAQVQALFRQEELPILDHLDELTEMMPFRGFFDIQIPGGKGFVLFNNNDDPIAHQFAWQGRYRSLAGMVWTTLAAAGTGLIVDVGGFNGLFSFLAAVASPMSQVVCFEPEREAFARIMVNVRASRLPNVAVLPQAVDSALGLGTLYRLDQRAGLCPEATLQPNLNLSFQEGQPISKITLDGFVTTLFSGKEDVPLVLAKIGVCGLEAQVLLGMSKTLVKKHPDLLITLNPTTDVNLVDGMLREAGYGFFLLNEDKQEVRPCDSLAFEIQAPLSLLATVRDQANLEDLFSKAGLM